MFAVLHILKSPEWKEGKQGGEGCVWLDSGHVAFANRLAPRFLSYGGNQMTILGELP